MHPSKAVGDEKQAGSAANADHVVDDEPGLVFRVVSTIEEAPVPPPLTDDGFDPPDGGWAAWSQVLAAHLINTTTWGYPATFGVYQLYYVEHLGLPASQVSWIGSVQVFLTFAMCAVSGRLSDAGYARQTVAVGCFFSVFGSFMTSVASEFWQIFLAQGVCTGFGLGLSFMPAISVTASYFDKNRSFALAIAAVGTSVGSLIFPSTVQYLTPEVGFQWAVRCAAFIALAVCTAACFLLKPYVPPRTAGPWIEWNAFRELPYVLFMLGSFLNFYAMYFGLFYVSSAPLILAEYGIIPTAHLVGSAR